MTLVRLETGKGIGVSEEGHKKQVAVELTIYNGRTNSLAEVNCQEV